MVDKALILRKLTELDEHLKQIKEFSDISLEDYSREWKTQRIVERTLQIMMENMAKFRNIVVHRYDKVDEYKG